ncbi:hypothetical protein A2U01_0096004, partial [Trifolium medium]|nr:hypothetical protein [Trifolium medium]
MVAQRAASDRSQCVQGNWRGLATTGDQLAQRPAS